MDFDLNIVTKVNAVYLLKRPAKLGTKRNHAKTFQLCYENLQRNLEERKEEEIN